MRKKIVLTTLNSRYTHTSIALRYLYANLKEFQHEAIILEYVINEQMQSVAEQILEYKPKIIGIGVYIWNASDVSELIQIIKKVSPKITIVLGGPEVSHQPFRVNFDSADYIIQGEGDSAFYNFCKQLDENNPPKNRIIPSSMANLEKIELPYKYFSDHDIAHRYIYVEASRGCPFLCEFCLSSIDEKVRAFDIDTLLEEFETLWQRGARNFKFIDRTFNLNIKVANRLLDFFLEKEPPYFAHFEVVPDHFPTTLKEKISQFPAGSLQLEVGIQTLNPQIAKRINRPLKFDKIKENIKFIDTQTKAHMHLDLIIGLPGEEIESFGKNLNELCSLTNSEIQIGILKKLSGTTLDRHDIEFGNIYNDKPPYDVLQTNQLPFSKIQKMKRFSRFWDLTYNSGNFNRTIRMLWSDDGDVYKNFYNFSEWIYTQTLSTWKISLDRLSELLFNYLTKEKNFDTTLVAQNLIKDLSKGRRKVPYFLRDHVSHIPELSQQIIDSRTKRQQRRVVD